MSGQWSMESLIVFLLDKLLVFGAENRKVCAELRGGDVTAEI